MAGLIGKQNLRARSFEPLERDFQYLIVNFLFLAGIVVGDYLFNLMFGAPVAVVESEDNIGMEVKVTPSDAPSVLLALTAYLYPCHRCCCGLMGPGGVGDFVTNFNCSHFVKKL